MTRTTRSALIGLLAVLLAALSLRIPTISLAPLTPNIRDTTGYGETLLSLLTSIPLAMTLAVAPISPWLARRLGRNRTIGLALLGIFIGTLVRSLPGEVPLVAGTLLLGVAIALGTVLIPASIAAEAPALRSRLTGTYSMALSLGPALALGLTIPIGHATGFGWHGTLAVWSGCALLALGFWGFSVRSTQRISPTTTASSPPVITGTLVVTPVDTPPSHGLRAVARDLKVWQLAAYLGITSVTFYATSTWLPTTFMMDGMTPTTAGSYTAIINIVAIPFAFIAPAIMRRGYSRLLAPIAPLAAILGVTVLLTIGSTGALASVILLGVSQGLCLGVSYDQIVRYATSPEHAASISAVTSASGVALAAVGPLAYGFGLEATGSAVMSLIGLGVLLLAQMVIGAQTSHAVANR